MKIVNPPYDIIAKELSGSASEKEKDQIRIWLNSSKDAQQEYEALAEVWNERFFGHEDTSLINQEEIGESIWTKAVEADSSTNTNWLRNNLGVLLKVAAVLVLVFSGFFYGYLSQSSETTTPEISIIEKKTLPGQKSTITLPDGSIVSLNAGSKILYASNFGQNGREIQLVGQAFFDVYKNQDKPFVVDAGNVTIEALGTSFDVNSYQADNIQVSLFTGKVKLSSEKADQQIMLQPGQFSVMQKDLGFTTPQEFEANDVLAWKNGVLKFRDLKLNEIIPILELWYGVEIKNQTRVMGNKHFNGTFNKESLEIILQNIGLSMGFEYEFKDNTVLLK
ncbi:MAG: FecR domain-containing protein [Cyclobacteriaceae bacterium]